MQCARMEWIFQGAKCPFQDDFSLWPCKLLPGSNFEKINSIYCLMMQVMSLDFVGKYNNWDSVDPVSRCSSVNIPFTIIYCIFIILFSYLQYVHSVFIKYLNRWSCLLAPLRRKRQPQN